jgi:hypothetical protein
MHACVRVVEETSVEKTVIAMANGYHPVRILNPK